MVGVSQWTKENNFFYQEGWLTCILRPYFSQSRIMGDINERLCSINGTQFMVKIFTPSVRIEPRTARLEVSA